MLSNRLNFKHRKISKTKNALFHTHSGNGVLRALVEANTCTTVRELASELDVTYTTISNLRKIEKMKKLDKWVPLNGANKWIKGQKPQGFFENLIVQCVRYLVFQVVKN